MKNIIITVVAILIAVVIGMMVLPNRAGYTTPVATDVSAPAPETQADGTAIPTGTGVQTTTPPPSSGVSPRTMPVPTAPPSVETEVSSPATPQTSVPRLMEYRVNYTDSGFESHSVAIRRGDTVIFTNTSSQGMWVASDFHPIHSAYPGSGLSKCGSLDRTKIFDSCASVNAGETYSFVFNEVGTWSYHNHVRPSHGGAITVSQ